MLVMTCLPYLKTFMRFPLYQNNFLQAFLSVPAPKSGGSKATLAAGGGGGGSLLGLWLKLLVNLSFAEDGQQSILRVSGALELLADLAQHQRPALLVLHNLCFCPANKPHVIANGTGRVGLIIRCSYFRCSCKKCMQYISLFMQQSVHQKANYSCWEIAAKNKFLLKQAYVGVFLCMERKKKKWLQLLILCRW